MLIDVIMASKGRSDMCARAIEALGKNAALPDSVVIWLVLDRDEDHNYARDAIEASPIQVHEIRPHGCMTLSQLLNAAWRRTTGDVAMVHCDDMTVTNKAWDVALGVTAATNAGHWIGWQQPDDQPGAQTYFALPRRTVERLGYFNHPLFPYWFTDNWLADVGQQAGINKSLDIRLASQWPKGGGTSKGGKTQNMRNLSFWASVYKAMAPVRRAQALALNPSLDIEEADKIATMRDGMVCDMADPIKSMMFQATYSEIPQAELAALAVLQESNLIPR